jgi:ribosomal protein S18 acetylase RimI-like enzyme
MKTCYLNRETRTILDVQEGWRDDPEGYTITRINTPRQYRGEGHASALLRQVCEDADRERATIYLEVLPTGGLNAEKLRAWYGRHGFTRLGHPLVMRRLPQRS